jgi:ribosome biogenesis GTPase
MRLAARCRFADCRHETEPGCAVLAAIEDGSLAERREMDRAFGKLCRSAINAKSDRKG